MIFQTNENTLTAYGSIWEGDGMRFINELKALESNGGQITLRLHTPGGTVFDGNLIHNALRDCKADIRIEIIGIAASMGAIIALSRDEVYMAENGFLMVHAPSGSTWGTADKHLETAKLLRSMERNFTKKLSQKTGKTTKEVAALMNGDNWMDSTEAKELGLIMGIIDPVADLDNVEDAKQLQPAALFSKFSAALNLETTKRSPDVFHGNVGAIKPESKTKSKNMEILAKHLGLAATADEATILATVKANEQKLQKANDNLAQANKELNEVRAAEANRLQSELNTQVDAAVKSGQLDVSGSDAVKKLPYETAMALLKALPKRKAINEQLDKAPTADWDKKSWDELDKANLLATIKKEDPAYYDARFEQEFGKQTNNN